MTGTYAAAVQRILIGRPLVGRLLATVGIAVAVVGTFLPWLRSGTRLRNSYEIFALVDRIGLSSSGLVGWGLRLWPIMPLLLGAAATVLWFPRRLLTGATVAVAVIYAGSVSAAVRSASSTALIAIQVGPSITLLGVVTLAVGGVVATVRSTKPRATRAPRAG